MERWRTSHREDADFASLLSGRFSASHRALPRRSLNVGGAGEEITFEIVPLEEIERPNGLAIALHALRPQTLILSLGPMLAALAQMRWVYVRPVDPEITAFALLGVLLFHASLNLLNDYADHMSGADRVNSLGGSRAIQRGWARAIAFRNWGLLLLVGALAFGGELAWKRPEALLPLGALSLGAAYYLTWGKHVGRRRAGVREGATFALGGPLLVSGFAAATTTGLTEVYGLKLSELQVSAVAIALDPAMLALGCAFGFSALLYGTLGNLESLMRDSLAGVGTLASRLGFDRAKLLAAASGVGVAASTLAYAAASQAFAWTAPIAALVAALAGYASYATLRAPSPLSSALRGARNRALLVHWALAFGLILALGIGRALLLARVAGAMREM